MALLSLANVVLSFGDRHILDGVNLTLDAGQHVGMVGRNGCGKSTLMKLIAGIGPLKADAGQIQLNRGSSAGYLTQDPVLDPDNTLREEAATAFAELHALHDQLDEISHQMASAEGDELDKLLKKYETVEHAMQAAGGYAVDHLIDATLHGLGLTDEFFGVKVKDLSGGQKGRLALAKLLLSNPDLLLLD
jgi:ATP-binding cassette subfamily F protein 3